MGGGTMGGEEDTAGVNPGAKEGKDQQCVAHTPCGRVGMLSKKNFPPGEHGRGLDNLGFKRGLAGFKIGRNSGLWLSAAGE